MNKILFAYTLWFSIDTLFLCIFGIIMAAKNKSKENKE